ncbi:MAG: hypothetical protein ABJB34_05185, partial [Acidobacteriota bacterium]
MHILAVKLALVKKNTEAPVKDAEALAERSSIEAVDDKTNNTESRVSERGEQTVDDALANEVAPRRAASKTAVRDRFGDTQGDNE